MTTYPTYKQLDNYVKEGYTFLPIVINKKVSIFNPVVLWEKIKKGDYNFILESSKTDQFTYIGGDPLYIIKGENGITSKINRIGNRETYYETPLDILKRSMSKYSVPRIKGLPKFYGGAVGYLSYDMVRYFEDLPDEANDDLRIPDLYFMIMDKLWIYDHNLQQLYYIEYIYVENANSLKDLYDGTLERMNLIWDKLIKESDFNIDIIISDYDLEGTNYIVDETSFSEQEYITAVEEIKKYISQGDVFQVNLSVRQSKFLKKDGIDIYSHLRRINPSPYMGFMDFQEIQVVSGSPELLIEVEDKLIQTRPIAGTRPRGKDELEDEFLVFDLLHNEKEISEHIMLVDLERNDIGRVCKYGTIKVNQLMVVEKYSHVMHIVSNIVGELKSNYDIYDCIKATFPGGTITGVPKIRTMEIIEELEPVKRGLYTGSMGWIGFNGDSELNILIRTLLIKEGKGYVQAGAGIVIDSIPENEYIESLNKAKAIWRAVESSEK
ncbi:MAG: anthranilate synthase component I family protein [Vulcanibacillus sp.]